MQMTGILAAALAASTGLWSASDPFVGKWKLDPSRSEIVDQMSVEAAGPNKYTFRFEGGPAEAVVADGTDQPGVMGTTLAAKSEAPGRLTVVRKQGGQVILTAHWTLAPDGRTLRDDFTQKQDDGTTLAVGYVYRRTGGIAGFAGDWESTTQPIGMHYEMQIQPQAGPALSFVSPSSTKTVIFDGQAHPGAAEGVTAAGRRETPRALHYTETKNGALVSEKAFAVSPDRKTLTMNIHNAGQPPETLVFQRE